MKDKINALDKFLGKVDKRIEDIKREFDDVSSQYEHTKNKGLKVNLTVTIPKRFNELRKFVDRLRGKVGIIKEEYGIYSEYINQLGISIKYELSNVGEFERLANTYEKKVNELLEDAEMLMNTINYEISNVRRMLENTKMHDSSVKSKGLFSRFLGMFKTGGLENIEFEIEQKGRFSASVAETIKIILVIALVVVAIVFLAYYLFEGRGGARAKKEEYLTRQLFWPI